MTLCHMVGRKSVTQRVKCVHQGVWVILYVYTNRRHGSKNKLATMPVITQKWRKRLLLFIESKNCNSHFLYVGATCNCTFALRKVEKK